MVKPLESIIVAVPILPGKTQAVKKYFETLTSKKWTDFCKSEERLGVVKERDFLQVTPNGDLILMYLESNDIGKVLQILRLLRTRLTFT